MPVKRTCFESVFKETRVVYTRQPVKASHGLCINIGRVSEILLKFRLRSKIFENLRMMHVRIICSNLREALGQLRKFAGGLLLNLRGLWQIS